MTKAISRQGVICTPHPQASEAGLAILDAGGTAIDAMLAASATLAVVYPHMTGLGGDAIWLLSDGREVTSLIGIGQAGRGLPEDGRIAQRGPGSAATTAGALRSWSLAKTWSEQQWRSRLAWPHLLEQAIGLAREGMRVSASQAFWQQQRRGLIATLPDLANLCCRPDGSLTRAGDLVRQPALADTLSQLARAGVEDFYQGEVAQALAKGFAALGNGLDRADLRATRAELAPPLRIRYRNGTLFNVRPPTQGLYTLRALNALQHLDLSGRPNGGSDYYHYLVEAIKAQLTNRNRALCEPGAGTVDLSSQLSRAHAEADFSAIDPFQAAPWQEPSQPADTAWFAATDREGRTACLIQSLFHDFGSGCLIGDTGVLWLNRAAGFNADPNHPNAWAPGRRPAHTLNPSAYLADNGDQFYFGTQGGDGQPQTQLVLATQLIDHCQSIESALQTPRFLLGRSFFDSTENLKLEQGIDPAVAAELGARGHDIEWLPPLSPLTGQAGVIRVGADGWREAMHDPRGQGVGRGQ